MFKFRSVYRSWPFIIFTVLSLSTLGCRTVSFNSFEAQFIHPEEPSETYTIGHYEDDWAIIEAEINGSGPYRLLLDTGADASVFPVSMATRIRLTDPVRATLRDIHGTTKEHDIYQVDEIRIGPVHMHGVPVIVTDQLQWFFEQHDLEGLIGYHGLNLFTLDLDAPGGVVRISDRAIDRESDGVIPIVDQSGATVIIKAHLLGLDGENESALRFGIDSGGGFVLSIPEDELGENINGAMHRTMGRSHGLNGVKLNSRVMQLPRELELAGYQLTNINNDLENAHTLIGSGLLRHFRVQIDPPSKLVKFSREGGSRLRLPDQFGIGVMDVLRVDDELIVTRVADQSPAMQAGVVPNDRILELNGKPANTIDGYRWITWQWEMPEQVRMTVIRDGERIELDMGMERLFPDDLAEFLRRGPDMELPGIHIKKLPDGSYIMYE